MLNESQIMAAAEYAKGINPTEIAKKVGVSRQTIYNWLDKEEFTSEVDKHLRQIRTSAERGLTNKVDSYVNALENIAFNGKSEKNRADALTYLLDRVLGRATTKVQDITEASNTNTQEVSWDNEKDSNILELKTGNDG